MPSISEILDSVSVPALIKDEIIKNGNFEKSKRGIIYYSGGFTVVFPITVQHDKWAFRCWHTEMGNVRDRFKIISEYINSLQSPYFCNFYYCDNGLIVDGKQFPTTRMKWVNGETINKYILKHKNNEAKLSSLANKFLALTDFLHNHHIAHGDLQHGNIIIENDEIKLVDYDSLFVPGLEGCTDIIIGKPDFQHPQRNNLCLASEKLDYFSELVIYLSILSVSKRPTLLNEFSIDDSLLFTASDWKNLRSSRIYQALTAINDNDTSLLLKILEDYLAENDINKLTPFTELWRAQCKEPIIHKLVCGPADGKVYKDMESTISWQIENAEKIFLNGEEMDLQSNSTLLTFTKDTTLTLCVRNGLHEVNRSMEITVLEQPIIRFSSNKQKLKKRKTPKDTSPATTLRWDVHNAHSVALVCNGQTLSTKDSATSYKVEPPGDTRYDLIVTGLDNITEFRQSIYITLHDAAELTLCADKEFSLPGVPVTVSWNTKHAKSVQLNGIDVPFQGKSIFTPETDETYVLTVDNELGQESKRLTVRMLPIPVIESVLIDTPNIERSVNIQYVAPQFEALPSIPTFRNKFVDLTAPLCPDVMNTELSVDLPSLPQESLAKQMSNFIKNIFK